MTGAPASTSGPTGYTGTVAHVFDVSNNMPWYLNPVNTFGGSTGATPSWVAGNGQVLIQRVVLGGTTGTVTFSAIPQVFNNLRLTFITKVDAAFGGANISLRFNGDTSAIYNCSITSGANSSTSNSISTSLNRIQFAGISMGASIANYPGSNVLDIPGYSNTTFYKTITGTAGAVTTTATDTITRNIAGSWGNTAAITSITLLPDTGAGNFIAGSLFYLYGVW